MEIPVLFRCELIGRNEDLGTRPELFGPGWVQQVQLGDIGRRDASLPTVIPAPHPQSVNGLYDLDWRKKNKKILVYVYIHFLCIVE